MAETKKRKAWIVRFLALYIEPYRYRLNNFNKSRIRRLLFSSIVNLIPLIILAVLNSVVGNDSTPLFLTLVLVALGVTAMIAICLVLVVNDTKIMRNYLILIAWLVLGFTLKRFQIISAGIQISASLFVLALGNYILVVKILRETKDNRYIKIIGAIGTFLIASFALYIVTKYQHWPGQSVLRIISIGPLLLLTFIVLVTLPNSGFISWQKKHKEIITRRLLIPWSFLMVLTALTYLLPAAVSERVFSKGSESIDPFYMNNYEIRHMEGLEEEFNK